MSRRSKKLPEGPRPNDTWVVLTDIQVHGRNVSKGTELKIKGERGRFRFVKFVKNGDAEWIDVWGGPKGMPCLRSFRLDRIKTVHYKNRTDENLAIEHKEKMKAKKAEMEATEHDE